MRRLPNEPPGWRELCAKLQKATKLDEFQAVLEQINRLLTAHEKAHPETFTVEQDAKPRAKKAKKRTAR